MIPSAAEVLAGFPFVASRHGLPGTVSEPAVRAAIAEARVLASGADDEPAAVFYAFAGRPRAFTGGWRLMARLLSSGQASRLGLRVDATVREIDALCMRVVVDRLAFEDVRQWFAARMRPR